jgi:hypothetical protein
MQDGSFLRQLEFVCFKCLNLKKIKYKFIFPSFSNIFEEPSFPQNKINPVERDEETPETTSNQIDAGKRAGLRAKIFTQKLSKWKRRMDGGYLKIILKNHILIEKEFFCFIFKFSINFMVPKNI